MDFRGSRYTKAIACAYTFCISRQNRQNFPLPFVYKCAKITFARDIEQLYLTSRDENT